MQPPPLAALPQGTLGQKKPDFIPLGTMLPLIHIKTYAESQQQISFINRHFFLTAHIPYLPKQKLFFP